MAVFWDLPALPHTDMESKRHRPEAQTREANSDTRYDTVGHRMKGTAGVYVGCKVAFNLNSEPAKAA